MSSLHPKRSDGLTEMLR
jgi:hypothetical protein